MTKTILFLIILLTAYIPARSQHSGMTFNEAKKQGISISHLDSTYKSALHTDTSLAVFKTDAEQTALQDEYYKLLQNLGEFLSKNNFRWEKPARCFNRIYFSADGTIDYFLFNFSGRPEDKPSEAKQKEFERLLNLFIKDYTFPLKSSEKFAQCSPATYMPK